MSDNYEKILNGELASGDAANLVEALEEENAHLRKRVEAMEKAVEEVRGYWNYNPSLMPMRISRAFSDLKKALKEIEGAGGE